VLDHLDLSLLVLDDVAVSVFGFVLDTVVVEPFDGVNVGQAQEGSSGGLEVGVELLDEGTGGLIFQEAVNGFADLWVMFRLLSDTLDMESIRWLLCGS
jgi:hypothetical protein